MFSRSRLGCCVLLIALASQTPSPRAMQQDAGVAGSIAVRTADVDGVKLQYSRRVTDRGSSCCMATPRPLACGAR